ncbi:OB-fold domain-containing protein [Candidatus Binatia bacterium]|nr:OB-fold domain-containing protein [Candidatus Binatia bacterium]
MTRADDRAAGVPRVLGDAWSLPRLDAHNRAFFTAGVLTLQQCTACEHVQHPPDDVCEACGGFDLGWLASAGDGRIESVAVVTQAIHPALAERVPYAIVLVSVADAPGVLVTGNVVGAEPDAIRIGDRVRVVFADARDPQSSAELRIPQWEIVAA